MPQYNRHKAQLKPCLRQKTERRRALPEEQAASEISTTSKFIDLKKSSKIIASSEPLLAPKARTFFEVRFFPRIFWISFKIF